MLSSQEIIKKIQSDQKIRNKMDEYGIKSLFLVGSYSKEQQNDKSDIDFVYVKNEENNFTLLDKIEFKELLESKFDKKIDLVSYGSIYPRIKKMLLSSKKKIV